MYVALCLSVLAVTQEEEPFLPHVEPASDEGRLAMEGFEPADGIQVELFAAEPMLANPVCFYVDFQGDFYVAETFRHYAGVTDMREHMDWLDEDLASRTVEDRLTMIRRHEGENYDPGYGRAHEAVRLIRDEDGDGVADTAVVFADGFSDHAAGIGAGLLSYEGDVYYTCIPDLWLLRDKDGDGKADERRQLSTGYGVNIALLGHDLHGLRIGPDRRLYFSCGDRGFHVETEDGVLAHPHTGAVLRCNLDGSGLEVWHTGLRNPQELVFDEYGNLFTGDNNSDGGDQARWVNVIEGGDSGWRYPYQWITEPVMRGPWNDEKLWYPPFPGQAAYVVPPIANLGHGPSGLTYYPGTGLSPDYTGHFFLCDFRGDARYSGIHTFTTEPRGAFWELGPVSPFVWKTLVTDCDFGPDGGLFFSDWVHGWDKTGKGRLYRAFHPDGDAAALTAETGAILRAGMGNLDIEELIELLAHADQRVRQEAHFELAERGAEGVKALSTVARESDSVLARLHAIWGMGIASRRTGGAFLVFGTFLEDEESEVRAQAIRVIGDEGWDDFGAHAVKLISDPAPRVRFFAAIAAGRLAAEDAVDSLAQLLRDAGENDRNLRHAGVMGLLGCASDADLERLAQDSSAHVRMGVLLVQRRRRDARIERFLSDPEPLLVLEAARAIHDVPIPAGLPALANVYVPDDASAALSRRVLNACYRIGDVERVAALAQREGLDEGLRFEALEMLAAWQAPPARDHVLNAWRPIEPRDALAVDGVAARIAEAGVGRESDALFQGLARFAVASNAHELTGRYASWAGDANRSGTVRRTSLEALAGLQAPVLPDVVRAAMGDVDATVRATALGLLEELSPGEALPSLPQILEQGELPERRAAYRILAKSPDPQAVTLLAGELEKLLSDLLPAELRLDLILAAEEHDTPELNELLDEHRAPRQRDAELAPYLDGLFGGDGDRGEVVFQRLDLSCVRCHRTSASTVQQIGPDLNDVSERLSRLQMLESIVTPNRRTTPGYGATVLFLVEGGIVNGRILSETPELIEVLNADGEVIEVDPLDVDERRPDLSAMPEDLAKEITRQEMRDLLEYLGDL